eukprot:CAMPEP_0114540704 /NCGR_PEP_ID=MMETSP0114-20121206/917_1 /TAXON_ID=31324 /ORGANISM="Goniomonas sp, Strain m" /LENGTH=231 /DNA_ID=CAMNT_0001724899 /DNA_START=407 /DNA_END=1103 /DNA_ORIENTATION=-
MLKIVAVARHAQVWHTASESEMELRWTQRGLHDTVHHQSPCDMTYLEKKQQHLFVLAFRRWFRPGHEALVTLSKQTVFDFVTHEQNVTSPTKLMPVHTRERELLCFQPDASSRPDGFLGALVECASMGGAPGDGTIRRITLATASGGYFLDVNSVEKRPGSIAVSSLLRLELFAAIAAQLPTGIPLAKLLLFLCKCVDPRGRAPLPCFQDLLCRVRAQPAGTPVTRVLSTA